MPIITRWFNVSHDINADPEMWELRDKFGDRAGFVWLECLSIADRNGGCLGVNSPQLHAVLASKCRVYSPKVRSILEWCLGKGWLQVRGLLYVTKWAKYNKTRDAKKLPSEPSLPTKPSKPVKNKSAKAPLVLPDWLDPQLWESFKDHRKASKKPLTELAEALSIKRLTDLRAAGQEPQAVIEQSIIRGWQALFPVQEEYRNVSRIDQARARTQAILKRGIE